MTIKASPSHTTLELAQASADDTVPVAPSLDSPQSAPAVSNTATAPSVDIPPAVPLKLKTKADKADEEAAKQAAPPAHGTHRFTLIEKEALALLSGKKPSTCMSFCLSTTRQIGCYADKAVPSTFAAFLPKALAPSNKCPVCHKRIGQRPALQCDDCSGESSLILLPALLIAQSSSMSSALMQLRGTVLARKREPPHRPRLDVPSCEALSRGGPGVDAGMP
jgi:LIM domain kinase 1